MPHTTPSAKAPQQVEPFIIFSFWTAFLFGVMPGMDLFHDYYVKEMFPTGIVIQGVYLLSVFVPLAIGIRRLKQKEAHYTGWKHVVAVFVFVGINVAHVIVAFVVGKGR